MCAHRSSGGDSESIVESPPVLHSYSPHFPPSHSSFERPIYRELFFRPAFNLAARLMRLPNRLDSRVLYLSDPWETSDPRHLNRNGTPGAKWPDLSMHDNEE